MDGNGFSVLPTKERQAELQLFGFLYPEGLPQSFKITVPEFQSRLRSRIDNDGWEKAKETMLALACNPHLNLAYVDNLLIFAASLDRKLAASFLLFLANNDENSTATQLALQKLARFKSKKVLDTLLAVASDSADSINQQAAIRGLSSFKSDRAADCLGNILLKGDLSRVDLPREALGMFSTECVCVESLCKMQTEHAALWLVIIHARNPECETIKKAIIAMPKKALPALRRSVVEFSTPKYVATTAKLIVKLGHGQSSLEMFTRRIKGKEGESHRQALARAIIALRTELASARPGMAPAGSVSLESLGLKRFPTKNPRRHFPAIQGQALSKNRW